MERRHILTKQRSGFGLNELLGRSVERRPTERDGFRLEHDDNRTCAATNLPTRISHGAEDAGPGPQAQARTNYTVTTPSATTGPELRAKSPPKPPDNNSGESGQTFGLHQAA